MAQLVEQVSLQSPGSVLISTSLWETLNSSQGSSEHIEPAAAVNCVNCPLTKHVHTDISTLKNEQNLSSLPQLLCVHTICIPDSSAWLSVLTGICYFPEHLIVASFETKLHFSRLCHTVLKRGFHTFQVMTELNSDLLRCSFPVRMNILTDTCSHTLFGPLCNSPAVSS